MTTHRIPVAQRDTQTALVLGDVGYTMPQLNRRVARIAAGFRDAGVGVGGRVGVLMTNDLPYVETMLAAAACGATPVPINHHSTGEVVSHVLRNSGTRLLVAHRALLDRFREAIPDQLLTVTAPTSPDVTHALGLPVTATEASDSLWADWLSAEISSQPGPVHTAGTDVAPDLINYTSGTTGMPKGVRRIFREVPAAAVEQARTMGIKPGLRHVVTGPMYHAAPGSMALNVIRQGGLVVLQPRFDPEELLRLIERHRITFLNIVPTMMVRMLALPEEVRYRYDLSSLECVLHGAGPCAIPVKQAMIRWLGPVVCEYYGGTEAGALTHLDSAQALAHPGSVGLAMPGVTLRIVDDRGVDVATGEIGEIYARNEAMPDFEYIDGEKERGEVDLDGYVTQGDLGYLDAEGYLHLAGRRREMIVSGGVNIYCAELEESLHRIPGVRAAAAFAVPDDELGEAVGVAIELAEEAVVSVAQVVEHISSELGSLKKPKVVEFTDQLTRSDVGKVFKLELARKYSQPSNGL